jgi:peptidyl-prolyl cis-trans isomerase SurA
VNPRALPGRDGPSIVATPEAMDVAMRRTTMTRSKGRLARRLAGTLAAVLFAAAFADAPRPALAQVVVMANGSPITALDIEQRSKLIASGTHKMPDRQEVINQLIDERIEVAKAKSYGLEVTEAEVDQGFATMAKRQNVTPEQFSQILDKVGITAEALKARIRAEMTWSQLVRGKFSASLNVGESDISNALRGRGDEGKTVGYVYTLYPVMVVVPSGASEVDLDAKRHEAENLRNRFLNCTEGLALARAVRDVAVRDPLTRSSADLAPQLRDLLASMEVGRLTTPDVTPQGLQMFALCNKKESTEDSPVKTELREQIFAKRFETEAKKYLDELRKQAMIEYK